MFGEVQDKKYFFSIFLWLCYFRVSNHFNFCSIHCTCGFYPISGYNDKRWENLAEQSTARIATHPHPPWALLPGLIRMSNTLYYKCFWGHVCHVLVYSRGRIAGGQDLVGQHSALPFRHTGHCSGHLLDGRVLENCHRDVKQQKLHTSSLSSTSIGTAGENTQPSKDKVVMKMGFKIALLGFDSVEFLSVI